MDNVIKEKKRPYFDYMLLFIVLFLLGFGLVMIYSTSSYTAALNYDDGFFYFRKQAKAIVVGFVVMIAVSFIPPEFYRKLSSGIYIFSVLSIFLILTPLGHESHGARRWIYIKSFSIQPAEIAKIGIIIAVAALLNKMTRKERASWKGVYIPLIPAGFVAALVLGITENFSSALIIGGIAFCMVCFAQGANYRPYVVLAFFVLCISLLVVLIATGKGGALLGFRGDRIKAWLNPELYSEGKGFQTVQSLYGIGSGGIWGKGLGKSMQKLGFLPEPHNDMIFSIICEELGLFGGLAILIMFMLLLWRIIDIALHTTDQFEVLILGGIFSHIAIQVIMNVAVVTNTMPNTGISLPFISYGGSSVIFLLAEIGMVIRIAKNCTFATVKKPKPSKEKAES